MRVVTGKARGRKLATLPGLETRPTTDMAKEAIFSAIQFELEGAMVLDLFAGSGQMGIEALSRGAQFAVFVDSSRQAQSIIRQNLQHTGLYPQSRVVAMDYLGFLQSSGDSFDILFMDPPYSQGMAEQALPLAEKRMKSTGILICETDRRELLPQLVGRFAVKKEYRYGRSKFTLYRQIEAPGPAE